MDEQQLLTLHHALSEAAEEPRREQPMPTYTFRISKEEREAAEELCERHGTSLAAFFRSCSRILAREYRA